MRYIKDYECFRIRTRNFRIAVTNLTSSFLIIHGTAKKNPQEAFTIHAFRGRYMLMNAKISKTIFEEKDLPQLSFLLLSALASPFIPQPQHTKLASYP